MRPTETELKLAFDPADARRLAASPELAGARPRRERFEALYFDTPGRDLARRGLGLRLRREGRAWVATLKAEGDSAAGLHRRPEWNRPARGATLDLSLFAGTPLAKVPGAARLHERLAVVTATRFLRTRWIVEPAAGSRLEVAVDEGEIVSGARRAPIAELEIEVLEGPLDAAFDLAEALAARVPLRLEPETKLARGLALAAGAKRKPERAAPVDLRPANDDAARAARLVAAACLAQAQANEAGAVASDDPEFIHQLRVALRRLRSSFRLFRAVLPSASLAPIAGEIAWAARVLGECRDWDVFVTESLPPLLGALGDESAARALATAARRRQREARRAAREAIASVRWGLALVRLARWIATTPAEDSAGAPPLSDFASARLRKGARAVRRGARAFDRLDAPGRHDLRIRVKRQRYAVEFLASLFRGSGPRRHGKALAAAQEALGLANDGITALAHVRELGASPSVVDFCRGWFAAREAAGIAGARSALRKAAKARRFWRPKPPAAETVEAIREPGAPPQDSGSAPLGGS